MLLQERILPTVTVFPAFGLIVPCQQVHRQDFDAAFQVAPIPFSQALQLLCNIFRVYCMPFPLPNEGGCSLRPMDLFVRA